MERGEEIPEDTRTTMECQPLCKQLTEDRGATTTWDEQNKEGDRQKKGSEGRDKVRMQPDEKRQTSTTLSSHRRTKKMKTESHEERTHVRKRSRARNATPKTYNHNGGASAG